MMMIYVKSFAAGLLGTALVLLAADYWTLRTTVRNLNTWALQMEQARVGQPTVMQPTPKAKP